MNRMLEIFDEMIAEDAEKGTRMVAISNAFLSGDKVKQGAKICMGTDEQALMDLFNNKAIAILMIVDKDEYFKRGKQKMKDDNIIKG